MFRIVLILLLVNVVVFLWPATANIAPHVYSENAEVNPHFVRLNKEIEAKFYSQDALKESPALSDQQELTAMEYAENGLGGSSASVDGGACYRLGPFMHQANFDLAQAVLFNAEVEFTRSTRASQESDVYRLFLGPFETAVQVADRRTELKQKRVLDHFSRKLDNGDYIISLGIYSSEESANSALRLFQDNLEGVKMKGETVLLPNSYWLHFALASGSSKYEQLIQLDWGENSVKLGPYSCQS